MSSNFSESGDLNHHLSWFGHATGMLNERLARQILLAAAPEFDPEIDQGRRMVWSKVARHPWAPWTFLEFAIKARYCPRFLKNILLSLSIFQRPWKFFFLLILVTAIGGRPEPDLCFLPGRWRWTLLPEERYGNSLSVCGSNTQPSNWEADILPLSNSLKVLEQRCEIVHYWTADSFEHWRIKIKQGNWTE